MNDEILRRLRIPEVHWKAQVTKIPSGCGHKRYINEYIRGLASNIVKGNGLYLHGEYGSGKSALAAICLREAMKYGHFGVWLKATQLAGYVINETMFDGEQTFIERAIEVPLLVLDEFQMGKEVRFKEATIEEIIRLRIDAKRATIVTSNIGLTQLKAGYPALYSVIQEALYPVKIWGFDFRAAMKGKTE